MRLLQCFRTFPQIKKSAGLGPHSGSELGADCNPWTPAAYSDSMVLEEDELWMESVTRFADGFGFCESACGSWSSTWVRPYGGVPMARRPGGGRGAEGAAVEALQAQFST